MTQNGEKPDQGKASDSQLLALSGEVKNQFEGILQAIIELSEQGHHVKPLLSSISHLGEVWDKSHPLSDLQLISVKNDVVLARKRFQYSKGKKPYYHCIYQCVWLLFWVIGVLPHRDSLYTMFSGGETAHTAVLGVIFGSIGASLLALGGLVRHKIRWDLDESFTLWYILKPITGGGMGGFVALLTNILMTGVGSKVPASTIGIIILSAFGGMHEAWAMGVLEKYTNKVLGNNNTSAASKAGIST